MLKIKLVKKNCKFIYNIEIFESKKKNSKKKEKLGQVNRIKKIIRLKMNYIIYKKNKGVSYSKAFTKILKKIKNPKNYDIQIL